MAVPVQEVMNSSVSAVPSASKTRTRHKKQLPPGFRFHPTDVELVLYYLKKKVLGKRIKLEAIAEVDLYKYAPWDLPAKSLLRSGDLEWYFFCPLNRHYANAAKTKRSTDLGYWKTTGKDRPISYNSRVIGMKKTLVFYIGRAGNPFRTNWVMHEYRLEDARLADAGVPQDLFVLCKVFEKSGPGPKNGEQRGAPFVEEEWEEDENVEVSLQGSTYPETMKDEPCVGFNGHRPAEDTTEHSLDSLDRILLSLLCDDDNAHSKSDSNLEISCVEPGVSAQAPSEAQVSEWNGLEIFEGLATLSPPGNYSIQTDLQNTLLGLDVEPSGDFLEECIQLSDFFTPCQGAESQFPLFEEIKYLRGYSSEINHSQCSSVLVDDAGSLTSNVNFSGGSI